MSTKALRRAAPVAGLLFLAALSACATPPDGEPVSRFSQVRLGAGRAPQTAAEPSTAAPVAISAPAPALRPRLAAPQMPAAILPVSVDEAAARVSAYLGRAGFAFESRPEDGGALLSGTRMGSARALDGQAVCALEAMRRPTISSTEVTVRLSPAPGGVQLQTSARFVQIDTKLLSGDLARETCRSQGVLESAVQRAALGG